MKLQMLCEDRNVPLPTRPLGSTGQQVTIFGLGGQGSLETQGGEKNCINIIQIAYELGVNYFDTAPIYGPSEDYYGKAIKNFRKNIFLATKTDDRTRDGSLSLLETSLKRLKTDYIDLWQIHHLDRMSEIDQVSAKNGALQALIEMKEEGVVKNIGITGHERPSILQEMMKRHDFDAVLCPVNAADIHMKKPFIKTVLPDAQRRGVGIIGMKVFAQGHIFDEKGLTTTWAPLSYAISQPVSTVIVGCDSPEQLRANVAVAKSFTQLGKEKLREIESMTKGYERRACFFRSEYGGYPSQKKLGKPKHIIPKV